MMMLSQIESGVALVDKAAGASDRWLFLALLVAVLFGGVLVVKYLVNSIAVKDAAHATERLATAGEVKAEREAAKADNRAERAACTAERKADQVEFLRVVDALKGEIKLLGESIAKNTDTLQRHDTDMRAAHSVEIGAMVKHELERLGIDVKPK